MKDPELDEKMMKLGYHVYDRLSNILLVAGPSGGLASSRETITMNTPEGGKVGVDVIFCTKTVADMMVKHAEAQYQMIDIKAPETKQ